MNIDQAKTTEILEEKFSIKLNQNYSRELCRLLLEVAIREKCDIAEIIARCMTLMADDKSTGKNKIMRLKKVLIKLRFPCCSKHIAVKEKEVYLSKLEDREQEIYRPAKEFTPEAIYVENDVKGCKLEKTVASKFPELKINYIDKYSQVLESYKPSAASFKRPLLFIINEKEDFLKPCPCTKKHLGCGYWILNLGFGCPFDCSYCYLQQYQNVPGILLPANMEDFLESFDEFHSKIDNKLIRIGTGEFCDSLALDHISDYSKILVPFFSKRNVLFELKTKSANINNLLKMPGSKNIVISWSLNPQSFIKNEEIAVASLEERLLAAQKIQKHGYSIAFHFDPIVPIDNWEEEYKNVIDMIYEYVDTPIAWISLGTLRFTRELKGFMEQRFAKSHITYGELLMGDDKKLRYPEFMRSPIFKKMVKWIKEHDQKSPVYLCMESKEMWQEVFENINTTEQVEEYIISSQT